MPPFKTKGGILQFLSHDKFGMTRTFIFLLFSSMLGCKGPKEARVLHQANTLTIPVNPSLEKEMKLSEFYKRIEVLKLQTTDKCRIDEVTKLLITSDYYIVGTTTNIFLFNKKGKFIRNCIDPDHLSFMTDFLIDTTTFTIEVYIAKSRQIVQFDSLGQELNRWKTNLDAYSFYRVDDGLYAIYSGNAYYNHSKFKLNFFSTDSEDLISRAFPMNKHEATFMHFGDWANFYSLDDKLCLTFSLSDTIYSITKDFVQPAIIIDFGSFALPNEIKRQDFHDVREFVEYCRRTDYAFRLLTFIESEANIVFGFEYKSHVVHGYYKKASKELHIVNSLYDDLDLEGTHSQTSFANLPRFTFKGAYYSFMDAHEMISKLDSSNASHKLLLKTIRLNDNPFIVIGSVE